ncbi:hypothetical protein T310_10224 [Rasamsonia emersonii CBS 393.64]|uniref:Uncharacterized protein n=1 Tax=Rasamsonia emersonii (strain ATCC 16479 / CBS 393.64 / IMI 116815) TaxID=1408163 RepID=A0A0F4YDL6_RASE3|nr:hypothetical protein T310_10224 [Rasamsonia emersonii CBS 393.64]KKA16190.1 hypothetical protein T310_10224 [Rasamsonia emersonii CBS 393.64]
MTLQTGDRTCLRHDTILETQIQDIILGPPKTSFASASRFFGKGSVDSPERSSRFNDSDDTKSDRYNIREKFFKDREAGDKEFDRRDNRFGGANGRRGDRDDWNHGRPRRNFGQDEQDRRPRRNGEPDRWDVKDRDRDQQHDSGYDKGVRDKDSRYSRRDAQGRARYEQSWFRDEGASDAAENNEEEKPSIRNREWRRDRQAPDRDWNRGARFEQEPEWMDSMERDDTKQAHTQEEFQRWKESMKARPQTEEKKETVPEQATPTAQKAEAKHLDGELFHSTALQMDSGLDKFFGLLGETKPSQDAATPGSTDSNKRDSASITKPGKSSRFAGFFSPPPDSTNKEAESKAQPDRSTATDADQEGFQRILQMLENSKSRNTTPHVDSSQQPRPPPLAQPEPTRPAAFSSPTRQHEYMSGQDGAAGVNSPRDAQAQLRDRENLLRLMQQVKISPGPNQQQQQQQYGTTQPQSTAGHTPGILNVPDLLQRSQGIQKAPTKNPNFLDDPAIANMQRPDAELNEQMRRSAAANGPPMGYFDEMGFPGGQAGGRGPQGHGQPPMGLQRPPGFDQMPPPPGWGAQQLQPQQGGGGPSPLAPPPGIPTPSRGMNPNFVSGPMPMHGGNMGPVSERPPFPRGMSGNNSGGNFGAPPGMMPPPGYMNMSGPPMSGYPPMPHNPEAMMNFPHGGQGNFGGGGNSGPSGAPPSSRHLLEMFAQANGGDGRGGMPGPGPYR